MGYSYRKDGIYFHHTRDEVPDSVGFLMHAHENFELYYFISGNGTYFVEGNEYRLTPGCVLLLRPGETHMPQISPDEPYERMALHFSKSTLAPLDPEFRLLRPYLERPGGRQNQYSAAQTDSRLVRACFDSMAHPFSDSDYDRRLAICSAFPVLLNQICTAFDARQNSILQTPQSLIGSVVDYINNNITAELNLDLLSSRFYISKSYLNQQFRQATGTTIWDYILLKRLILARSAIRSGVPVTNAFRASGFNDYSSFYRRYKNRFGISPKDDRPIRDKDEE